MPSETTLET